MEQVVGHSHFESARNHENYYLRYILAMSLFEQVPYVHSVTTTLACSVFKEFKMVWQSDVASDG
jgi:hypothetical protein